MEPASKALQSLISEFENLPGVGRRTAERLAYFILRSPAEEALALADAIRQVKEKIRHCGKCFNIAENELCSICDDPSRDRSTICVVEQTRDLQAIEQSGSYRGLYHVLQGTFAPLEGVSPADLTIDALVRRVREPSVREIILATNPNFEGDGTALYLDRHLREEGGDLRITRLARGMPSGSNLEHVSRNIVADALEGRREMEASS